MIKGIIFDFDGLILDTETPIYQAWSDIYRDHNTYLPLDSWLLTVGTAENSLDPLDFLEKRTNLKIDRPALQKKHDDIEQGYILQQPILAGVQNTIHDALNLGLLLGVASSSPRSWVHGHLSRLGLIDFFQTIVTQEDVTQTKPYPYLFQKAVKNLGLFPYQVIAFEDSAMGVTAAKTAGIFTIAIPNSLTKNLMLDHADMVFSSMSEISLSELISKIYTP